ncbi:hypothetical protein FHG87_016908 [Trinorchestia longiramus]|nr:hypothetical protein FHG87_016908 [Trinorchestia longiramus]
MVRTKINKHDAVKQSIHVNGFSESTCDEGGNECKSFSHEDSASLNSKICQHNFVTKVHIVIPCAAGGSSGDLLPELSSLLTDNRTFIVRQLPLSELVSYNFIQSFIKSGMWDTFLNSITTGG